VAKWWEYCLVSFSNVVATSCQYEALKYVSFPVQTLGKCAKMIPVRPSNHFLFEMRCPLFALSSLRLVEP
jgi:adenosine 3'-phospho 5'-phosphosulfate transporter B2